jgi:hypothetical protein
MLAFLAHQLHLNLEIDLLHSILVQLRHYSGEQNAVHE